MTGIIHLFYGLVKLVLGLLLFLPVFILTGIISFLNSKGQLNEIEKDLKKLLNWITGGDF